MTKQDLIDQIRIAAAHKTEREVGSISKKHAEAWLEAVCETVAFEVAGGGEVTLPGIGKLSVKAKPARTGRNPATGEEMAIPAKTVPHFSPAKALKDAVK